MRGDRVPARVLAPLVALVAGLACSGPGQQAVAPLPPTAQRVDRLQAALDDAVARGVPAVAARVETPDWTWTSVAGVASVETGASLTEDHRFRLASVTKLFTEVVVLQLVDEGKLRRDDTITQLLNQPVVAEIPHAQQITVEQLIRHESGVRSFTDVGGFFREGYADGFDRTWQPDQLLTYALRKRPYFRPGEGVHYSSSNYILLGMIIEEIVGKPLHEVFRDRLFEPLNMEHTSLEGYDPEPPGLLDSYAIPRNAHMKRQRRIRAWGEVRTDHLVNLSANYKQYNAWSWAAGGLNASVGDLATFFDALRDHALLSEASEAVVRGHSTVQTEGIDLFSHGGGWDGISSLCEELGGDTVVVVLMNGTGVEGVSAASVRSRLYREVRRDRAADP